MFPRIEDPFSLIKVVDSTQHFRPMLCCLCKFPFQESLSILYINSSLVFQHKSYIHAYLIWSSNSESIIKAYGNRKWGYSFIYEHVSGEWGCVTPKELLSQVSSANKSGADDTIQESIIKYGHTWLSWLDWIFLVWTGSKSTYRIMSSWYASFVDSDFSMN